MHQIGVLESCYAANYTAKLIRYILLAGKVLLRIIVRAGFAVLRLREFRLEKTKYFVAFNTTFLAQYLAST